MRRVVRAVSRILLEKERQKRLLDSVYTKSGLNWSEIARICNICERTLRDWRRAKYHMDYRGIERLHRVLKVPMPKKIKILPEHWNAKRAGNIGALKRYKIYGNPGTPQGRAKGGQKTQNIFRLHPEYARKVGFILRKEISYPNKCSELAEFIGIVLGDGGITQHQVTISMNGKKDVLYGDYIKNLILKLFKINPHVKMRRKNTLQVVATGRNLVEFLQKCGMKQGDKVAQQVDIPEWIMKNKYFMINCLRGLVDTDGGLYFHTHTTNGLTYRHIGLCFTNKSIPLLNSTHTILLSLGISGKNNHKNHVSIYNREEIKKYMNIVGSHNRRILDKFNSYTSSKI